MRLRLPTIAALALLMGPVALAAEPVGDTLPWNLLDCVFVYGTTFVPAPLLAARTPPGFRLSVLAPAAGTLTQLGFEVNICAEGSGIDAQVAPMTYASTWSPAIAPPSHSVPGYSMFVNWDVLVPDEARRTLMLARGTPAHEGDIAISVDIRQGLPNDLFVVEYDLSGVPFRFEIQPVASTGSSGGRFAQYTPGADGDLTYWRTHWRMATAHTGVGTISLSPESWQAQELGTTLLPARFVFGTWEYTDGKIVLPDAR